MKIEKKSHWLRAGSVSIRIVERLMFVQFDCGMFVQKSKFQFISYVHYKYVANMLIELNINTIRIRAENDELYIYSLKYLTAPFFQFEGLDFNLTEKRILTRK